MNFNLKKVLRSMPHYDVDDVLDAVGLQQRSSGDWVFPMLAGLGCGMAIGAGLAFFLTPYKGSEAREKISKGAHDAQKALGDKVSQLSDKVSALMGEEHVTGNPIGTASGKSIGTPAAVATGNATGNRSY